MHTHIHHTYTPYTHHIHTSHKHAYTYHTHTTDTYHNMHHIQYTHAYTYTTHTHHSYHIHTPYIPHIHMTHTCTHKDTSIKKQKATENAVQMLFYQNILNIYLKILKKTMIFPSKDLPTFNALAQLLVTGFLTNLKVSIHNQG